MKLTAWLSSKADAKRVSGRVSVVHLYPLTQKYEQAIALMADCSLPNKLPQSLYITRLYGVADWHD